MQMLFETSGWALPKNIAAQKKENESTDKKDNASQEADQLQAQINALNDQPKDEKPNQKNKKRALEQKTEEPVQKKQKKQKNKQQEKKQDSNNKNQQKKQDNNNQKKNQDKNNKKDQKKKKLQEMLAKKNQAIATGTNTPSNEKKKAVKQEKPVPKKQQAVIDDGLTPLQRKMKEKLSGARFRWLNEQLYTTPGKKSFDLFQEKPELFDEYHEGFRHQVESWPENPVDIMIDQLKELPEETMIADLGCGDAMIARTLTKHNVLSFDLIAKNELVTACDISKLPLDANTIDVAVFSLSLMGTNYIDFLKEAHRVLKMGGELKIAEVVSRFSDLDTFITLLESLGFEFIDKEDDNKMFVMLYFTKAPTFEDDTSDMLSGLTKTQKRSMMKGAGVNNTNSKLQRKAQQLLKPCLYKKR